jgi:chromosome segregation ATPase
MIPSLDAARKVVEEASRYFGRVLPDHQVDGIAKSVAAHVRAVVEEKEAEIQEYDILANLQRQRERPWIKRWQQEIPGKAHTLPDYGEMLGWLVSKAEAAEDSVVSLRAAIAEREGKIHEWKTQVDIEVRRYVEITRERDALRAALAEREKEMESLKNDLLDALDLKEGKGPTALSMVAAERDALRAALAEREKAQTCEALGQHQICDHKIDELTALRAERERLRKALLRWKRREIDAGPCFCAIEPIPEPAPRLRVHEDYCANARAALAPWAEK